MKTLLYFIILTFGILFSSPCSAFRVIKSYGSMPIDREGMEAIHGQLSNSNLDGKDTKVIVSVAKAKGKYECTITVNAGRGTATPGKTYHGQAISSDSAACVELSMQSALSN